MEPVRNFSCSKFDWATWPVDTVPIAHLYPQLCFYASVDSTLACRATRTYSHHIWVMGVRAADLRGLASALAGTDAACKAVWASFYFGETLTQWLLVSLNVDRFLLLYFPLAVRTCCAAV